MFQILFSKDRRSAKSIGEKMFISIGGEPYIDSLPPIDRLTMIYI